MSLNSPADYLPTDAGDEGDAKPRRKAGEAMDDTQIESLLRDYFNNAKNYRDEFLTPDREKIQRYFEGDKDLDGDLPARKKRSQFVSRDVRDVIGAILPQLFDILFGNDESIVEFVPVGPEDVDAARDATQYVQYLVRKHGGDELWVPVILDALKNHVGVVRFWWDKRTEVKDTKYEGLTDEQVDALAMPMPDDPKGIEREVVEKEKKDDGTWNAMLRTKQEAGNICFAAVPPEERLIDENARSLRKGQFTLWAHARSVRIGELVAMGYEEEELADLTGGDFFLTNEEAEQRENAGDRARRESEGSLDPSMREVPYAESYVYGDLGGEGFPQVWYVCAGGSQCKVLHKEVADGIDVAEFQSVPIEHVATGSPFASNITDVQALRTSLWRGILDSLAQSIFPQRGFMEGQVSVADLMNDEPGALVRCKGAPAQVVQEFPTTFAGREALAVLAYTDQTKEERTGVSRNSAGLDADALQSVAKGAADSVVQGAERQIKFLARMLANYGGMKALFKGVLRLVVKHQRNPERVRLHNGQFAEFDPSGWNPDMDVIVRTGIGSGTTGEKLAALDRISGMQKELAAAGSEMVTPVNIYQTADAYMALTPYRNASRFFTPPNPNPAPKPPPPPSPEQLLAQAQMIDSQTKRQTDIEKNRTERLKVLLENDLKRDQLEADFMLKLADLAIKAHQPVAIENLRQQATAALQRDRNLGEYMNAIMLADNSTDPKESEQQPAQPAAPQQGPMQ